MSVLDEIAVWPACRLQERLQDRTLSPVDVAEACLDRVSTDNPAINAVVTLNPRLLEEARALERQRPRGLLYGLPVGLKDTTETRGLRTTYGSPVLKDNIPARDAVVVQRLKAEGAIILGKTNTPAFATGASTWNPVFGHTHNPWDLDRTAGGSTGGGAAALATGMIALADGTDLGGSLRIPAAFCGIVGLRPTPGLVPLYPTTNLWDTLSVAGGMGRTAEDVALFLQAVAGPASECALQPPTDTRNYLKTVRTGPPDDLHLGWCPDPAGTGIESAVLKPFLDMVKLLGAEHGSVQEIHLDLSDHREVFAVLRGHHLLSIHYARRQDSHALGTHLHGNLQSAQQTAALELAAATRSRHLLREQFSTLFRRIDYLLVPTVAVSPFLVEQFYPETICGQPMNTYYDWLAPTSVFSLTGYPAVSVPCGLDHDGMPVGLQIIGKPWDEANLLALANQIEQLCPIGRPTSA